MPPTPATPGRRIGNRSLIGFFKLYGRAMKPPLARNIAEVIDDLYRQHAPPRDHERLIEMGSSIRSSMRCGWRLRRNGHSPRKGGLRLDLVAWARDFQAGSLLAVGTRVREPFPLNPTCIVTPHCLGDQLG